MSKLRYYLKYAAAVGGPALLGAVFSMICTRIFMPTEYSEFISFFVICSFASTILSQWVTQSVGRFLIAEDKNGALAVSEATTLYLVWIVSTGVIVVLIYYIGQELGFWSARGGIKFIPPAAIFIAAQITLNVCTVVLQSRFKAGAFSLQQNAVAILKIAITVYLFSYFFRSPLAMAWGVAIASVVVAPFSLLWSGLMPREIRLLAVPPAAKIAIWRMIRYGSPMTVWFVFNISITNLDKILLPILSTPIEAGIYAAYFNLVSSTVGLATAPVLAATWPLLLKSWEIGESDEAGRMLTRLTSGILTVGATLVGLLFCLSEEIVSIFFGTAFRDSPLLLPAIAVGIFLVAAGTYAHKPFEFSMKPRLMIGCCGVSCVLSICSNFVLLPLIGRWGSALSLIIAAIVYFILCFRLGQKYLKWQINLYGVLPVATLSVIAALSAKYLIEMASIENLLLSALSKFSIFIVVMGMPIIVTMFFDLPNWAKFSISMFGFNLDKNK